ncbi:UrcA family protein [Brevundimonas sp. NPDC090276]|uniref:UrcA family protein n=1 Tax=Brevundimonas sp. NPDC090276 TaxID=3363956 RepID=UPI003839F231
MQTTIIGVALLLAIATPTGAQTQAQATQPVEGAEVIMVSYADLDLNQPTDSRTLDHRLKAAARRTCDTANLPMDHYLVRHWCIKDAVADGWSQVSAHRTDKYAASRTVTLAALRPRR